MTSITDFHHDCCLNDDCPGHRGWVACDSLAGSDFAMVQDIHDAADTLRRRARLLDRFGSGVIADPENARLYDEANAIPDMPPVNWAAAKGIR